MLSRLSGRGLLVAVALLIATGVAFSASQGPLMLVSQGTAGLVPWLFQWLMPDGNGNLNPAGTGTNPVNVQVPAGITVNNVSTTTVNGSPYRPDVAGAGNGNQALQIGCGAVSSLPTLTASNGYGVACALEGALLVDTIISANPALAPTPVSASASAGVQGKNSPGVLVQADASNLTTTPGWLVGYDAATTPAGGASLTPSLIRFCVGLPAASAANGLVSPGSVTYSQGKAFTAGVQLLVSSTNCGVAAPVYTTGTVTAFISAQIR